MKKLLVAMAVLMSVGTCAFAQTVAQNEQPIVAQVANDDYKEVKAEELSAKVQEAIKSCDEYTVTKLEYCESKKLTRVTLTEKSTNEEKVVILDEEGKEVK